MQDNSNGGAPPPWAGSPYPGDLPAEPISMTMPEQNGMVSSSVGGLGVPPLLPAAPSAGVQPHGPQSPPAAPTNPMLAPEEPPPFVNPMVAGAVPYGPMQPPAPYYYPMQPQPVGVMPQEGSQMLGLSTLAVAAGAIVGARYGGFYGSIAGGLVGGAAVNAFRALHYYKEGTEDGDKEAKVSATYAVLSAALSGYLFVKHVEPRKPGEPLFANPGGDGDDDGPEPAVLPSGPCALRSVGPRVVPTKPAAYSEVELEEED